MNQTESLYQSYTGEAPAAVEQLPGEIPVERLLPVVVARQNLRGQSGDQPDPLLLRGFLRCRSGQQRNSENQRRDTESQPFAHLHSTPHLVALASSNAGFCPANAFRKYNPIIP